MVRRERKLEMVEPGLPIIELVMPSEVRPPRFEAALDALDVDAAGGGPSEYVMVE